MSNPANETVSHPFSAFAFSVEIAVPGVSSKVCSAAFAECDGLEMSMDVKTIREGGNNGRQIRLTGPTNFGQLTLKRGMTATFDLWNWFAAVLRDPSLRADGQVVLLTPERPGGEAGERAPRAMFRLRRCLPVKLKAPALNAKDGVVAIEELGLLYESLTLQPPPGA